MVIKACAIEPEEERDQLLEEIRQLRGELTMAEEGLANYQQENAQLRESLLRLSVSAQRISEEAALALARGGVPQSAEHPSEDRCPHGLLKTYHCYRCSPRPD